MTPFRRVLRVSQNLDNFFEGAAPPVVSTVTTTVTMTLEPTPVRQCAGATPTLWRDTALGGHHLPPTHLWVGHMGNDVVETVLILGELCW